MAEQLLKDRLIRSAVRLMLDRKLNTFTPALIMAASFHVNTRGMAWDAPSSEKEKEKTEKSCEELRRFLKGIVLKYLPEDSVRLTSRGEKLMSRAFMMIAEEEDGEQEYTDIYRSAVIENGKGNDSVLGLIKILIREDANLGDEKKIAECVEKAKDTFGMNGNSRHGGLLFERTKAAAPADITKTCMEIQAKLRSHMFGQDEAIDSLMQGYTQYLSSLEDDTGHSPAVFLFAGPSGTGKSSLAKAFRKYAGLPFKQFDMTQFADHQSHNNLIGFSKAYRNSMPGTLTSFVRENPECVILFDEIEKAHVNVKNLFLQILEDSVLHDDYENDDVDFSRTILIFTTNAGRSLYENTERKLSTISKETVVSAIAKEFNDSGYRAIPSALLSRFAAGNIIMFEYMDANAFTQIIRSAFDACAAEYKRNEHIEVSYEDDVIPSVLYSLGAGTDARKVSAKGDSFMRQSIMSLLRKLDVKTETGSSALKKVRFACDPGSDPGIRRLFMPEGSTKILFFGFKKKYTQMPADTADKAAGVEDALKKLASGDYGILLCDIGYWNIERDPANRKKPLSDAKQLTNGRILMERVLEEHPSVPVYVLEDALHGFDAMDRTELRRQGVRGFLNIDSDTFREELTGVIKEHAQEKKIFDLARSNTSVSFNVIEFVSENGEEAEIRLCEYTAERNIQASDSGNVLDKFSMPSETFDDIIGQEHVKQEMKFFISYLKDPLRFRDRLRTVPKGLLLYGPAGTGKTMLAKAFAHEAGLAFISSQGNEFTAADGSEKLHRMFSMARRYAPAVIFIDEIDALARERTGYENFRENALTALLTEMDGFSTDRTRPVFVIAATNYMITDPVKKLDPAVLRRFDNRLFADLPDKEDRLKVLRAEIDEHKDLFRLTDPVIENTAARTAGRSFAWIRSMVSAVIRAMIMQDWDIIDDRRFEDAFEEFSGGTANTFSEDVVLSTARHEAGHALINAYYGNVPAYITITSRGNYGGYTQTEPDENKVYYTREDLFRRLCICMAGRAAEIVCYGKEKGINTGAYSDLCTATGIAQDYVASYGMDAEFGNAVFEVRQDDLLLRNAVNRMLEEALDTDIRIITDNRKTLDALTDALMKKNHLNKAEAESIFAASPLVYTVKQ